MNRPQSNWETNYMSFQSTKNISVLDVFKMSIPMMISALSAHFMLVIDQLILAEHSIEAMAGATSAALWSAVVQNYAISTTSIAGMLAGHYNGASKFTLASRPVWQMIWFSIFFLFISVAMAFTLDTYCIPKNLQNEGIPFFHIIMSFSPLVGVIFALSSFFVALEKGWIVIVSVVTSNAINIIIGTTLTFGYFGISQCEGSKGVAIGTVCAWFSNIAILSFFFFKKDMRKKYATLNFKIHFQEMKQCLKLGTAGGIGHIIEMMTWSFLYYLIASLGKESALIQSMAITVNLLLSFFVSGIGNGMMYITANLIGSGLVQKTKTILKKGLLIHFVLSSLVFCIFFFFPEIVINLFIKFKISTEAFEQAFFILKIVWLFYVLDGACWIIAGVIEGGGDIAFATLCIALPTVFLVAVPAFILNMYGYLSIELTWYLLIFAFTLIAIMLYSRYKFGKWNSIKL